MKFTLLLFFIAFVSTVNTYAVRPFITDDARVVGYRLAQWETWARFDHVSGQQWHMFAYGPHSKLELSIGGVLGYDRPTPEHTHFSYATPLVQGKYLLREYSPNKWPGVGIVAGTFLPVGKGEFVPPGYGAFSFLTISQCIGEGEKILIHANVGGNYLSLNNENKFIETWGLGTQIKTYKGFHIVGEVFSGDPYIPGTGLAYQVGFRHFINDLIQIDATVGKGLGGTTIMPIWWSVGIRLVTTRWENKRNLTE